VISCRNSINMRLGAHNGVEYATWGKYLSSFRGEKGKLSAKFFAKWGRRTYGSFTTIHRLP
jgi:hypothetical protein